jgi:flagellar biosynthesis protein FlhG
MRDDQAAGLRRLFVRVEPTVLGVSGVEATPMVLDLADSLAELGRRVLVIDRTRGEATGRYGRRSRYELADVLAGDLGLAGVLHDVAPGVSVLPAARGFDEMALDGDFRDVLRRLVDASGRGFDVWLVNGLLPESGTDAADLIALSPSAAAITGAYATMKALAQARERREFRVIVHDVPSEGAARALFDSVAATAGRFLAARLDYRGAIPRAQTARERGPARRQALLRLAENLLPAAA